MNEETTINHGEVARLCLAVGERQFAIDQCLRPVRGRQQVIDNTRVLLQRRGDTWALKAFEDAVERVWSESPIGLELKESGVQPLALFVPRVER